MICPQCNEDVHPCKKMGQLGQCASCGAESPYTGTPGSALACRGCGTSAPPVGVTMAFIDKCPRCRNVHFAPPAPAPEPAVVVATPPTTAKHDASLPETQSAPAPPSTADAMIVVMRNRTAEVRAELVSLRATLHSREIELAKLETMLGAIDIVTSEPAAELVN